MRWVKSTTLKTDPDLAGLFPIADQADQRVLKAAEQMAAAK